MKRIGRFFGAVFKPVPALLCDLTALCGAALVVYAAWLVFEPAGVLVAGLFLLAAAWAGQRRLS